MRIVGGIHRGRALAGLGKGDAAAHLRPTGDRVRESLFNLLAHGDYPDLDGARVLDVFAGTGALGLEALSRGAGHVTFIEQGRTALKLLRDNIARLGVEKASSIITRDARRPGPCPGAAHYLCFLDPPYGKALGQAALTALNDQGWLAPHALVVLEEGAEITLPAPFCLLDRRRYGETHIHLARLSA